jgi:hypothetical protein
MTNREYLSQIIENIIDLSPREKTGCALFIAMVACGCCAYYLPAIAAAKILLGK